RHQELGDLVEALEVVGGEVAAAVPVEAEPAHVALDRLDVLHVLGERVAVVEAQVAVAAEVLGQAEVEADRLGVADVRVAVGLGREAGDDSLVLARREAGAHYVSDEVLAGHLLAHGPRTLSSPADYN